MKYRIAKIVSCLVAISVLPFLILRDAPSLKIAWQHQLLEREYVHCLAASEEGGRPILVAGIQKENDGSRSYDNYIVCFDLATGDELWRRNETKAGDLRGGKRPTSIEFDKSGNLIVGWDYFAVKEGDFEVVSKLSARDGRVIWDWVVPSEGVRVLGTGYSHGAWILREGSEILVKTTRSVDTVSGSSDMQKGYFVIDSSAGKPQASSTKSASTLEARWRSRANSLAFTASDGSQVSWGRYGYEHIDTNWFRWQKREGIWAPVSHWERRERVQVTRTPSHKSGSSEQYFVGREQERAISLVYLGEEPIPSVALLIEMSVVAGSRKWRVVRVTDGHRIGQELAHGFGMSHNFDGPIRLTKSGALVISGSMLQDQSPQKITVWK